jgi:hypothetical protein
VGKDEATGANERGIEFPVGEDAGAGVVTVDVKDVDYAWFPILRA